MKALTVLSALLLFAACQAPPPPESEFTDAHRQAVAEEIRQASQAWISAWAENNIDGAMAVLSDDSGIFFLGGPAVWVNNVDLVPTTDRVRASWGSAQETRAATGIFPLEESIAVLSPNHAVQVWVAEWNVTDTEGVRTPNYPLTVTLVWVRDDGTWRILHRHQSWNEDALEG